VLLGIGGAGKSQLALQYSRIYCHYYAATLWVDMSNPERSFEGIATLLGVRVGNKSIPAVHQWLADCKRKWLLILDNADSEKAMSAITECCPPDGN